MGDKMKMTSVDLRPDRMLIDSQFDSYKLSLNSLPSYKTNIAGGVYRVVAGDEDFGYEKIRCLTLHNHLTHDPWNKKDVYYIDSNGCIRRFHIPLETHIESPKIVFSLGSEMATAKKKLPPTLYFPSSTACVACDGLGGTFVLDTGLRSEWRMNMWTILYFNEVCRNPCVVLHAVQRTVEEDNAKIDYVDGFFMKFEDVKLKESGDAEILSEVVLQWYSLKKTANENEYNLNEIKVFRGKSVPNYISLSTDCSELHLVSSSPFKFYPPLTTPDEIIDEIESEDSESDTSSAPPPPYKWKQTAEEITVFIDLPKDVTTDCIDYTLNSKYFSIGIRDKKDAAPITVLSGDLYLEADPEASTWSIVDGQLEITIQKRFEGRTWFTIVEGDNQGELIVDPEEAARVHEKLSHLTSETLETDGQGESGTLFNSGQLEDCDAYFDSTATVMRFDAVSNKFTHVADISSLRWIFNFNLSPTEPPVFVLRHDVDAIAWQPTATERSRENKVLWNHVATFNALGYVHASKTNLKFCASPPDSSYAAFCECQRRIYVYRQPTPLQTSLRNRTSGAVVGKIAVQQVATIDGNDDILGFAASSECMYLLTAKELIVFKVLVDDGA